MAGLEYANWGFPIYRTAYGGSTDQHWKTLVDTIRQQVPEEMEYYRPGSAMPENGFGGRDNAPNPDAPSIMLSLFRLDTHSDPELLDGANIDRVRQIYLDNLPNTAYRHITSQRQLFLLADAEVLAAVARGDSWIKICDPLYKPENYIARNSRIMAKGLWFLGYMWMTTRGLFCLWSILFDATIHILAPRPVSQRLTEVWNGRMATVDRPRS